MAACSCTGGAAGDGSLVCSDDPNIISAACGKRYVPFPPGCLFISGNGLMSFDRPLNKVRGIPREDGGGNISAVIFQVDLISAANLGQCRCRLKGCKNWLGCVCL